ncbi:hypothetical protein [Primorskyibacter sp. S87]|uniref:hypothetical protein n=1 Tax=Primorskyibacter sp. S87 TaxID=3415126 RepID=UPI003C7C5D0D
MIDFKTIAASALIATVAAAGASAQTFTEYGSAGGWNVFTKTDDKTCVIETRREGLIVQMGILANQDLGYIGAFTQETAEGLEQGNEFIIDIDGDLFTAKESVMEGNSQGYSGAFIKANNPAFISDIANKQTMKVIDADRVFTLDLSGTKAAMDMGRECIMKANSN